MFKLIMKVENVNKGFLVENNTLVYSDILSINKVDLKDRNSRYSVKNDRNIQKIVLYKNEYRCIFSYGILILDEFFNEVKVIKKSIGNYNFLNENCVECFEDKKPYLYDITESKNRFNTTSGILRFFDNRVYNISKESINLLDIQSGDIIWKYSFPKTLDYVPEVSSGTKDFMLVGVSDLRHNHKFLSLSVKTGEVLWERLGGIGNLAVNKIDKLIYKISNANVMHIELETGIMKKRSLNTKGCIDAGIDSRRSFVLYNNFILTTDSKKGIIGAFNVDTDIYDWVYEIEGVLFYNSSPMLFKYPYLFVHDSNKMLYIFEIEKK